MRLHPIVLQVPLALLCAVLVACSQQADPDPSDPPVGADADPEQGEAEESGPSPEEEQAETPVGWATEPAPADGEEDDGEASAEPEDGGGVTGGGDTEPVTATGSDELTGYLEEDGPLVVELEGAIELDGDVQVPSDTTLVGSDGGTALTGGGLVVDGADNVVLSGLAFDTDETAVSVRGGAGNVWVHRSTFTGGDGGTLLEVADGADHVTVAWNRFSEADSALAIGGADDEPGALHVTVHHNHFDGTAGHHPRARNAEHVHVFNNYFRSNAEYGVESAHASNVLVEGNYFQNSELSVTPDEDDPGNIEARDNLLVDTPQPEIRGEVADPPYVYELDPATEIPDLVGDGAGVPD